MSPHKLLNWCIAMVWFVNGLLCKVLNLVPRHTEIVARILGGSQSRFFTILIGAAEILMSIWILSGIRARTNAVVQIALIATMNIIELALVPYLLLWGRLNSIFAFLFILLIWYNEFRLNLKTPSR